MQTTFSRSIITLATAAVACLFSAAHATTALAADGLFPKPTVMSAPATPAKAPDFEFANLHGGTLKSSDLKGKVVVIRFWATW